MMLLDSYFPYYQYQNQIIYLLTGNESFKDDLPMNVRFLGIYLQLLLYKILPCIKLTGIELVGRNELYECTTFSLAVLNYICKYVFLILFFFYVKNKLSRSIIESFISLLLAIIFLQYLENFTLDRLTILYFTIILYFLNNTKISNILILLSILVNEKIIMVLGPVFFIRFLSYGQNKSNLLTSFLTVFTYIAMIIIFNKFFGYQFSEVYDDAGFYKIILNIFNKSHLSNSLIPILFCIIPYIASITLRNKFDHKYSNYEILIPLIMWLLAYGGGENNIGRYVMHTMPLWIPIFASQIIYFLKIKKIL